MPPGLIHFWKQSPFLRILIPTMIGIILQWYYPLPMTAIWVTLCVCLVSILTFFGFSFYQRFRLSWLNGLFIFFLYLAIGALLTWYKDIRNNENWFEKSYSQNSSVIVSLNEPLVEKAKSYKAEATVEYVINNGRITKTEGKIIIYFKRDSTLPPLDYGTRIIINKPLQEIRNSGNPGAFNYRRYTLFRGITRQVFLANEDFEVLNEKSINLYQQVFYPAREKVLQVLRNNIKTTKERGLAEALLVGYKNDLDKTLVQSYSNTGVVHVIAISGLHLGLIYWLLIVLLKPLQKKKSTRWLYVILVVAGLWGFSLLAGGQPSVLRSAVMFTCLIIAQSFSKRSSIYNTLAFSAFLLLCYNPYWLWDVGFQLSYAAVLSIVIFFRPIYNWFYVKNKLLDFVWKLNAVTLSAQILTLPISVFHFHQFPFCFWLTNLLAVPLSSLILIGEIILCALSFIPSVALLIGNILSFMILYMNNYIEAIEKLPFSLWDGLQINMPQVVLLFGFIAGIAAWLMEKIKPAITFGLSCWLLFAGLRFYSFAHAEKQQKIIVYNVPQHRAIDFVDGRRNFFVGDSELLTDDFARNFHLKPTRISYRLDQANKLSSFSTSGHFTSYHNKKLLLIDKSFIIPTTGPNDEIDVAIISGNPKLYISRLTTSYKIRQIVFDGSIPAWKLRYWKKDCDSLHIPYHDVSEKGAFVMTLN